MDVQKKKKAKKTISGIDQPYKNLDSNILGKKSFRLDQNRHNHYGQNVETTDPDV